MYENQGFLQCCWAVNFATPDGVDPICTSILDAGYPVMQQVENLENVREIFGLFGNTMLTVQGFINTAVEVNNNAGTLNGFCSTNLPLGYCVNPTDSVAFIITEPTVALESIYFEGNPTAEGNFLEWNLLFNDKMSVTLEKSKNGIHYFPISTYPVIRSSMDYSFIDTDLHAETTFYRLVMEYSDGTIDHSRVISLLNKSISRVSLVSNLVSDELQLNILNQEMGSIDIKIFNTEGQNLLSQFSADNNIDVSSLIPGLYFLRIRKESSIQTIKFLKY
jgi:hypothetical protein